MGVIPTWFGLDLSIPTDVGVVMGIALFTLIQGTAWVLAKRSGHSEFIGSLLMCTLWTLYFKFSNRVHNTYFGYVAPAERVMPTEKTA
ncbi:DUF2569 family protein [Achromobacter sp. DH1f]|uniref:DUF2569 family protein n=1 Tax=Achromobacter sp. DH1f TaxID=1397275 RepID=UPI000AAB889F|nr:DUF2569 family protein [Achromobacter sp. DH1f]